MDRRRELLRQLPSVDYLVNSTDIMELAKRFTRKVVVEAVRDVLQEVREAILNGTLENIHEGEIVKGIKRKLEREGAGRLTEVINGTGVVLHTNLGRAPLSRDVANNLLRLGSRYVNLEYNLEEGKRGSRHDIVRDLLCKITGAEDALVVNNNAAAVLLVLSSLARGKEVIISRGQLVEIGGAFRVPEVMEQGGARLVEVGTTNKTYIHDYEGAIGENTGLLLKVHTSNYRICGFTKEVSSEELVELGRRYGLPVVEDLGSGVLVDLSCYGLSYEPTVQQSIKAGMDVVTISGDKLLGGPQAGIILGKSRYIREIARHPLARAVRIDKLTLAALEATLMLYLDPERALKEIPVLRLLTMPLEEIERRALKLKELLGDISPFAGVEIEKEFSQVGGGAMPLERLETRVVLVKPCNMPVSDLDRALRTCPTPVVGRISKNKYMIDVRTVFEDQLKVIAEALRRVLAGGDKN